MCHCFVSVLHNIVLVHKNITHILLMQTFPMSPIILNALIEEVEMIYLYLITTNKI